MAPVVVELGAQNGLLVPLIAVHLFVFYFGLMADVTPPVGLASYAAAGIARCSPIKTGVTAFGYSIRTAILPFMFIFNTQLLLIGIDSVWHLAMVITTAIVANLLFAAATQGWFIARNKWWESVALLLVCFTFFRPGFWMDMVYPPYKELHGQEAIEAINTLPDDERLRMFVEGLSIEGDEVKKGVLLPLGPKADNARARLAAAGVKVVPAGDQIQIIGVDFGSQAEKLGIETGFNITSVELPEARPAKEWFYLPALLLLAVVVMAQRGRRPADDAGAQTGRAPAAAA